MDCPLCGKAEAACGHQPLAFPPIHAPGEKGFEMSDKDKVYLPQQRVRPGRGIAGYRGRDVVVVHPITGQPIKKQKPEPEPAPRPRGR